MSEKDESIELVNLKNFRKVTSRASRKRLATSKKLPNNIPMIFVDGRLLATFRKRLTAVMRLGKLISIDPAKLPIQFPILLTQSVRHRARGSLCGQKI